MDDPKIKIIQKGTDKEVDSYSGFYDNKSNKSTGLTDYLKNNNVSDIYICGLATDYCVQFTALDGVNEGFDTTVIKDACRGLSNDLTSNYKKNAKRKY